MPGGYPEYDRERYAAKKSSGTCARCRDSPARPDRVTCAECSEAEVPKKQSLRHSKTERGLCTECPRKAKDGKRKCSRCLASRRRLERRLRAKRRREERHARVVERDTCHCGGTKFYRSGECKPCWLRRGVRSVVSHMLAFGWSTISTMAESTMLSERGVYRAIARINNDGGKVDVVYEAAPKSSLAHYKIAKPPTWYRP